VHVAPIDHPAHAPVVVDEDVARVHVAVHQGGAAERLRDLALEQPQQRLRIIDHPALPQPLQPLDHERHPLREDEPVDEIAREIDPVHADRVQRRQKSGDHGRGRPPLLLRQRRRVRRPPREPAIPRERPRKPLRRPSHPLRHRDRKRQRGRDPRQHARLRLQQLHRDGPPRKPEDDLPVDEIRRVVRSAPERLDPPRAESRELLADQREREIRVGDALGLPELAHLRSSPGWRSGSKRIFPSFAIDHGSLTSRT
jgi:hypothetical protein